MRFLDLMLGCSPPESSRRIGLVLGGGAMRGAAHLGVLQVFEEEGIQPDIGHTSFVDFGQTDLLVEKGREAALAHVARIKADLGMTT